MTELAATNPAPLPAASPAPSEEEPASPPRPALTQLPGEREMLAGLSGAQKALLFLVSVDESVATKILGHLDEEQVRRLRESSHHMDEAHPRALRAVHHEFLSRIQAGMPASLKGSHAYLRRLAGNALGEGRAAELWSDRKQSEGWAAVAELEAGVLHALLESEQSQTVAVVLSQLPAAKAAELVGRMAPDRRQDVVLRLAMLESVPQAVLEDIEDVFRAHLSTLGAVERATIEGKRRTADIVKRLPEELGQEVLESLRGTAPDAAETVENALFTFNDLMRVDKRGMQQLLKEIPTDQLVVALKTASEELKEKVFGNVSSRAADVLSEELELMGPVKLSDVEAAQREIVQIALDLERDGRIAIAREGGGDYV